MARTIMIMAGGTGGHVFPALAVAGYLKQQGWRVVWLGAKTGMEATLVPKHGYEVAWVRFSGLRGKGLMRAALLPFNLLVAFWQSARAIFAQRPDVVLGMGGYISFPGGMMASLLHRPLVIHEQNSVAGLANKVLARLADKVLEGFPGSLPGAQFSGNPVRQDIAALGAPGARYAVRSGRLRLLVVGGSLGAQILNETVPQALALLPQGERPEVTHQAGEKNIEALRAGYAGAGVQAELVAFIDDMAARYAGADVVLCRAGALTIAELACAGVASILVPLPHAVDDHQTGNAKFLSERGAAVLLPQSELTPENLARLLRSLDRQQLLAIAEKARQFGKPEATRIVADTCKEVAR
jgi:UDP-N-acetylglucosamine--N-acetylmuramyl-(pentapeptide) pyrophosphoryl-undecaprenol N-acetylglucosamine transferase